MCAAGAPAGAPISRRVPVAGSQSRQPPPVAPEAPRVMALMLRLVAETGAALLMATHSMRLAARLDRRLHLRGGRLT